MRFGLSPLVDGIGVQANLTARGRNPGMGKQGMQSNQHLMIHALPEKVVQEQAWLDGLEVETVKLAGVTWQQPFSWSFETLVERLERLGAACEWDGAWGWFPAESGTGQPRVQVGGTAHCLDQRVMCIEVFAQWDADHFRQWAAAIIPPPLDPEQHLLVQSLPSGHFLTCQAYCNWLRRSEYNSPSGK